MKLQAIGDGYVSNIYEVGNKKVYPLMFEVNYGQMQSLNSYLYDNGEQLILIDACINMPECNEFFDRQLKEYGLSVEQIDLILLTHHHGDHVGQVNRLLQVKNIPIYAHHASIERLTLEESYLEKRKTFFYKMYNDYGCLDLGKKQLERLKNSAQNNKEIKISAPIHSLYNGDEIAGLKVIEVPGHSPDSIIFYDAETKWQFAGDLVLNPGSTNALIDFDEQLELLPTVAQYEQSLKICREIDTSIIFPGHQPPFDSHEHVINKKLQRIQQKSERVVEIVKKGHHLTKDIAYQMYREKLEKSFGLVMSEVIGYLEYCVSNDKLTKTKQNDEWYFDVI